MSTRVPMSEADFQGRITDLCDLLGLRWHHEVDSRKSKSGFPDLVIVGNSVVFVELKKEDGTMEAEQIEWARDLHRANAEHHVWRPSNWPAVELRLKHLAGRA